MNLEGLRFTFIILFSPALGAPRGIAIDTVNNRVFWCDKGKKEIEFVDFDGTNRGVLVGIGIDLPNDVVVSNKNGVVIWCDTGMKTIERSYSNGSGRVVIVSGIANMMSLALDYKEERVYWGDRALQRIESVYLDGSDRRIHVTHVKDLTSFDPYGIALRGEQDAIHFTEFSTGLLFRLKPSATEPMATQVKTPTSSPALPDAPRLILFISDSATTTSSITTPSTIDHLTTESTTPRLTANSATTTQSTTTAESITDFSSSSSSSSSTSSSSSLSSSFVNSVTTTQSITTDEPITDPLISPIMNSKRFALGVNVCVRDHVISTARVKTSLQCAMMCTGINDCISFNFHPDSGLCELNDGIPEDVLDDMPTSDLPESSCRYFEMKEIN
ncbi:low-density lipoprotein receptor-related protein 8-like isoform X2 [Lytechinus pictus]|uniref:low-density lipoprotein receptor-related protein 8-like isoform X2 n=1 Tax=Lytechinus pictus TaxID=7653 RepID=UPI0030B9F613